jgi:transposase
MKDQLNYQQMPVIHQHVAGIDIGSKFHVVAVGDNAKTDVKEFGVSTKALFDIALFLKENGIQHVAMEATGGYEKPLVSILQQEGFEVLVTAGANTKNYRRFNGAARAVRRVRCHPYSNSTSVGLITPHFHHRRVCY